MTAQLFDIGGQCSDGYRTANGVSLMAARIVRETARCVAEGASTPPDCRMTADGQLELALVIVVRAWVPMKRAGKLLGRVKNGQL